MQSNKNILYQNVKHVHKINMLLVNYLKYKYFWSRVGIAQSITTAVHRTLSHKKVSAAWKSKWVKRLGCHTVTQEVSKYVLNNFKLTILKYQE